MKNIHLIKQHDEKDCGAACLAMILEYHGKKLPMAAVREAIQVDRQGANITGVMEGAEQNGLTANAYSGNAGDIWHAVAQGELAVPAIVRILNWGVYEHFVVINGIENNRLKVYDPDCGRRRMTREQFDECFLGQIITFAKGGSFTAENRRKGQFSRFLGMIGHQKGLIVLIGLLSLFITGIGLAGTFLFRFLIDGVLGDMTNEELLDAGLEVFALLITCAAGLYLVKLAVQLLRGKLLTVMSKNIDLPLMLGYYDHVTQLPMRFFDTRKTGEILSRFNDAGKIRDAISGVTLTLMIDTVMVAACGVVLHQASHELFHVALVIFALYVAVMALYVKPLDKFNRELMEKNAQFSSYLKESIDGMETVKTSQAEKTVRAKVGTMFRDFVKKNLKGSMLTLSKDTIIDFITSIGTLVILWVGAVSIINGDMTVGTLVTFVTLLSYFLTPVQNLVELQSNLQTAVVAADRLNDVLDLESEQSGEIVPEGGITSIAMENVSFRYGARELVLDGISFDAKSGEQIALVGESGCGKSTISKLLEGLYQPESGQVKINGVSTMELSKQWLRSRTACVPQNTFLFSDTVRNNLLLGLEEDRQPTDEELERVLDACQCGFIKNMPLGIDTVLEENGMNLSGGERQRLAIARALLRKPSLLILDEATSALDTVTEYKVQQALREYCPDMTVLVIAHRLSTVKHCDRILVIDRGRVAESGTHAELLEDNDRYADLWNRQNGIAA